MFFKIVYEINYKNKLLRIVIKFKKLEKYFFTKKEIFKIILFHHFF